MTIKQLQRGAVICNRCSGQSYVVIDVVQGQPIAVRTVTVTNPQEWEIVQAGFLPVVETTPTPTPTPAPPQGDNRVRLEVVSYRKYESQMSPIRSTSLVITAGDFKTHIPISDETGNALRKHGVYGYATASPRGRELAPVEDIVATQPAPAPSQEAIPEIELGPVYEDGGRMWRDVRNKGPFTRTPPGSQFKNNDARWHNCTGWQDGQFFYSDGTYRVPAKSHQMATEATQASYLTLPITLTAGSPQPPPGSVVLAGKGRTSYQELYGRWMSPWDSRDFESLIRAFPPVVLIYVPPETNRT